MNHRFAGLCGLALLCVISTLAPVQAQTGAVETRPAGPYYDITREVTLTGTVSSVVKQPSAGMIAGSHLLLQTASGEIDASLGRWGLVGKGALSVAAGDQIEVTGMMKTLREKPVFVVRTVKAGGQVYTIRTQYGIAISPQGRQRASQKPAPFGRGL
jgi:hypothetical protein